VYTLRKTVIGRSRVRLKTEAARLVSWPRSHYHRRDNRTRFH
jgi:hypothetical protein